MSSNFLCLDIYHPHFLYGRPAYFDGTVCNSFQPKFLAHSAYSAGFSALDGEITKDCKCDSQVSVSGALFYPLAVESFGCWTSASLDTLKTIASKIVSTNSIPFSQAYRNLLQQISVTLWSYNARKIQSRLLLDSDDSSVSWDLPVMSDGSLLL